MSLAPGARPASSHYRGHKLVSHGGGIDGFSSQLAFPPNEKIGVVVFTNLNGNPLPNIVAYNVFDRLLGLDLVSWNQRFLDIDKKRKQSEEEAKQKGFAAPKPGTHPSHDLKDYAGEYENPGYGRVAIETQGDGFLMKFNRLNEPLRHFHYDVFEIPENPLDPMERSKVMFQTNVKGDIASLSMRLDPNVGDIVFMRTAERRMREKSFLEVFAGQYELPGNILTIALRGDHQLVASTPGQPARALIPRHGTLFELEGLNDVSIEFKTDASGKVTEAVYYQGGSVSVIKRK